MMTIKKGANPIGLAPLSIRSITCLVFDHQHAAEAGARNHHLVGTRS